MAAPTRRAAPVTSAALPASGMAWALSVTVMAGSGMRWLHYDAGAVSGRRSAFPRRHGADRRAGPGSGRLDPIRAIHGSRALRAGTRVLQRGQREAGPGRGFRDGPGDLRSLQPLRGAAVRAGAARRRRV